MMIRRNKRLEQWINSLHMTVADSGHARLTSEWQQQNVCSPFSRVYIVLEGDGFIRTHAGEFALAQGHAYLLPPGLVFDYRCDSSLRKLYFHLILMLPDGFDLFARCDRCLVLPLAGQTIDTCEALYQSESLEGALLLEQLLLGLIARFMESAGLSDTPPRPYSTAMQSLFPIIQQSLSSTLTVRELARRLSLSESTLARRFKAEAGLTLGQYIDTILFQRAQQLLLTSESSIGQIAETLGFCDQFYFSRYFKQRQSETPSQYRKRLQASI